MGETPAAMSSRGPGPFRQTPAASSPSKWDARYSLGARSTTARCQEACVAGNPQGTHPATPISPTDHPTTFRTGIVPQQWHPQQREMTPAPAPALRATARGVDRRCWLPCHYHRTTPPTMTTTHHHRCEPLLMGWVVGANVNLVSSSNTPTLTHNDRTTQHPSPAPRATAHGVDRGC